MCLAVGCQPATNDHQQPLIGQLGPEFRETLRRLSQMDADVVVNQDATGRSVISVDLSLVENPGEAMRLALKLPPIDRLDLTDATLRPRDFETLARFTHLRWLSLATTNVRDEDLTCLRAMQRLEFLLLWGTEITNAGLEEIAGHDQLLKLDLAGTRISSEGLAQLATLGRLLELHVATPTVTEEAVQAMRSQLPNTLIVH